MNKMNFAISLLIMLSTSCMTRDTPVDKTKLLGADYRLFQDTRAWPLAKAVADDDTLTIGILINNDTSLINVRESRFGQPLLKLAVMNKNYYSAKVMLELGADPNLQDFDYGESAFMASLDIGLNGVGSDPRFLELLLKYGGNVNITENGPNKHGRYTPLIIACKTGDLNYVKILINAGAKINALTQYGDSALKWAMIKEMPEIVMYLLTHGADFKHPLYKTIEGKNKFITDDLRDWRFEIGSVDYEKKMQIVKFLKKNGIDYWQTPIPEQFKDYPKDYLEKY